MWNERKNIYISRYEKKICSTARALRFPLWFILHEWRQDPETPAELYTIQYLFWLQGRICHYYYFISIHYISQRDPLVEKGRKTRNEVPRHKLGCFRSIHGVIYHPSLIYYFLFLTRQIEEFSLAICSVSLARCSVSNNVRDRNCYISP